MMKYNHSQPKASLEAWYTSNLTYLRRQLLVTRAKFFVYINNGTVFVVFCSIFMIHSFFDM